MISNHNEAVAADELARERSDEIDLVEVLAGIWRGRFAIAAGIVLGVLTGAGIYYVRKPEPPKPITVIPKVWHGELVLQPQSGMAPEAEVTVLNDYLTRKPGAMAFVQTLEAEKPGTFALSEEAIQKIMLGTGVLGSFAYQKNKVTFEFRESGTWSGDQEIKEKLPHAFNAVITSYNGNLQALIKHRRGLIEAQLKIGELKNQLLDNLARTSHSMLSHASSSGELPRALIGDRNPDVFAFLLASSSYTAEQRLRLQESYLEQLKTIDATVENVRASEIKVGQQELPKVLAPVAEIGELSAVNLPVEPVAVAPTRPLSSYVLSGGFIGAAATLLMCLVGVFLRKHQQRFRALLEPARALR